MTVVLAVFNGNQHYINFYGAFELLTGKALRLMYFSQPSVVTFKIISRPCWIKIITFYANCEGEKVAKLESITTGSLLRVTPR